MQGRSNAEPGAVTKLLARAPRSAMRRRHGTLEEVALDDIVRANPLTDLPCDRENRYHYRLEIRLMAEIILMRAMWCRLLIAISAAIVTIDVATAQQEDGLGRREFMTSCASCHGETGKGDGPVAKSLVKPPADLTRLAEKNNGVFPVSRIYEVIDGRVQTLVHGTRDMPVWGNVYMQGMTSQGSRDFVSREMAEAVVRARILMLVEYISTLQTQKRGSR